MSNKKYWVDITIHTRQAGFPTHGSYRTKAPTVCVFSSHLDVRRRKTVDVCIAAFEAIVKVVKMLEFKKEKPDAENQ